MGRARLVHARRAAREDHRQRVELADPIRRDVVADDPRERVPLANPAGDELDVLRTEVEDEYRARCDFGIRSTDMPPYRRETRRFRLGIPPLSQEPSLPDEASSANSTKCEASGADDRTSPGPNPENGKLPDHDRLCCFCPVRIREEPEGRCTAELLAAPETQATAARREEAIEQIAFCSNTN